MNTSVLVVGDCHINKDQYLHRFLWLGDLIAEYKPDNIVLIGDFVTLDCFSSWDKNNKAKMEGKRYKKEISFANAALNILVEKIGQVKESCRKHKKRQYSPNFYYIFGNHEDRLRRYLECNPELIGHLDLVKDLKLNERGMQVIPYKEYLTINEVEFTHVPICSYGKPLSQPNLGSKIIKQTVKSTVYGHTHELSYENFTRRGAPMQQILSVGCFMEEEEAYAKGSHINYWRGVVLLDIDEKGYFDFATISLDNLEGEYERA